jgi:hypothetical protein
MRAGSHQSPGPSSHPVLECQLSSSASLSANAPGGERAERPARHQRPRRLGARLPRHPADAWCDLSCCASAGATLHKQWPSRVDSLRTRASVCKRPERAGAEPVDEGYAFGNVLASYVHLHFGSAPSFATALVSRCREVDVAAADAAAKAAAQSASLQHCGSHEAGHSQGSRGSDQRRRHSTSSMVHVRSTPNLADVPHQAQLPPRG